VLQSTAREARHLSLSNRKLYRPVLFKKAPWEQLNAAQSQAVKQTEGPVLILAGAGTGKTRVVTTRITYLVHKKVDPTSILAVTFTNKAANEMRERVATMVKKEDAKLLTICTFHSLCVRLLRVSIEKLGYKKNFTIYSGSDQTGLIRRIITRTAAKDEKLEPSLAISLISKAKNSDRPVDENNESLISEVYRRYTRELKALNAVDFDDLLVLAVKLLEEHPDIRDRWRQRFNYLMVDEFQDTNGLQMRLLQQLANSSHNVCVVGDDDQSIYGWRGAEVSNILHFERFFPSPVVVKLEENYRSTKPILETANHLIRHNATRREKRLWTQNPGDEKIRLMGIPNDQEEAELIAHEIWDGHHVNKIPFEDYAVLLRMNTQSRILEQTLREHKIPYRLIGGKSFFDRREIKDLLAYLTVFCNPHDDISLLRVINTPTRGIGKTVIELALQQSVTWEKSIYSTIKEREFTGTLGPRARTALAEFVKFLDYYSDAAIAKNSNYADLAERLMKDINYAEHVAKSCRKEEEKQARAEALGEFMYGLRDHQKRNSKGLQGYLDDIALLAEREKDDDIEGKKGVCLITLHAAKGLEFPRVYLIGLEEGILPHKRSIEEGTRDEERRLLYVGITRAKQILTLTYCHTRKRYGDDLPCFPSSFIKELNREYVEEVSYDDWLEKPASEDQAKDAFAKMREMLEGIPEISPEKP
jgi:DNA helicase-2/ATP-dependent DNA helicase PcrA